MIQDTEPFIQLGWHTIKLGGELKRLPNGKKTIPIFGKDWLERALHNREMHPTPLGGAVTGKESGIIAIDCDNTITYNLFKALDPTYEFHFISRGKRDLEGNEQACGTIIYKYIDELSDSFKVIANSMHLDFLSTGRMTYLPTIANETKEPITSLPKLTVPPPEVIALLRSIQTAKQTQPTMQHMVSQHKFNLAPQVDMFVKSGTVSRSLFRLLTPKDFRECSDFKTNGFLHPKDVADGRGSEYLSKVSAILGADASISVELYCKAMEEINDAFSEPMQRTRLNRTIIEPMCEEQSTGDDGHCIWQEDPDWERNVLTFITKYSTVVHTFYDYKRRLYYLVDLAEERAQIFMQVAHLSNHLDSVCMEHMKLSELKSNMPVACASSEPEKLFGFFNKEHQEFFNTFISTTPYKVFKTPEDYAEHYNRPEVTLKYFETLVPDPEMRRYLLGFLRRKLDTFDYSPVILYFLGVPGSGKDTFVSLLETIIGNSSVERPTAKMFLEKNNAWILDKFFIQLDEYGDQLTTFNDKREALGLLKLYTGKPNIAIRVMREDVYSYDHKLTFIMTTNSNPLMLEADDRRIALFDCPNALIEANWIYAAGGIESVIRRITEEASDFCYYLATEVENLDSKQYTTPPSSRNKEEMIAKSMPVAKRIAYYLRTKNWKMIRNLGDQYGPRTFFDRIDKNRLLESDVVELYEEMKGGSEETLHATNIIRTAMKDVGISVSRTNLTGNRHGYIYEVPGLYQVASIPSEITDDD